MPPGHSTFSGGVGYRGPVIPGREADAIGFVLALGRALHRYGTPADRLEQALGVVCTQMGLAAEIFTTPTTIIMSFGDPTELRTRMLRVTSGELDMHKLEQVDALADAVAAATVTPADGVERLERILASPPRYGRAVTTIGHAFASAGMAVFFGGTLADATVSAAIGLMIGFLSLVAQRSTDQARVFELLGAAFAALTAGAVSSVWGAVTPQLVTIASLIVLLPGLTLTVAMTELATRNLIAGTARLMSAVIVLLELVVGVALGERVAVMLFDVQQGMGPPLPAWSQWIALIATALAIAVVVQASPRAFGWIISAAVTAYAGSLVGTTWLGAELGVVVGAFALGVLGNAYARVLHRPAQLVLVPAVLVLVPGSVGFRGLTSLLGHDTLTGVETVFSMFVVAIGIVAGLLIANAVVSPRRSL